MAAACTCHSDFFCVAAYPGGLRIRNDEVVGSIPTSSTISIIGRSNAAFHGSLKRVQNQRCVTGPFHFERHLAADVRHGSEVEGGG
jgi:hypothetical protein